MVTIEINNNKGKLFGPRKDLMKIQKAFKVRNPNAYFIRQKMGSRSQGWDGSINYVTDSFIFNIGLLPRVHKFIKDNITKKIEIVDYRKELGVVPKIPKKVGHLTPRGDQYDAIKSVIENKIKGTDIYFPLSSIKMATNSGKSLIMAGIFLAYKKKIPTIVILNDGDLFEQFKKEFPELLPGVDIGFVRGKEVKYTDFTIVMAQTVSRNIHKHKQHLSKFGICLVDEADLANNKTYKTIISNCINTMVRVGLSATLYMSKLKKDLPKNMDLLGLFSEITFEVTKKENQDRGYSTRVIIKIIKGNEKEGIKGDYAREYKELITLNKDRCKVVAERIKHNKKFGRLPALVVCQYHEHIDFMYKVLKKELKGLKVAAVHGDTKDRKQIISDFRQGKIDVMISTYIIKRGKNFPLLRLLINAAGGKSEETVDQILGRLERTHGDKSKAFMEDLYDEGFYLKKHSRRRLVYWKKMSLKIRELHK